MNVMRYIYFLILLLNNFLADYFMAMHEGMFPADRYSDDLDDSDNHPAVGSERDYYFNGMAIAAVLMLIGLNYNDVTKNALIILLFIPLQLTVHYTIAIYKGVMQIQYLPFKNVMAYLGSVTTTILIIRYLIMAK